MAKLLYASLSSVATTFLNFRAALETLIPYQHTSISTQHMFKHKKFNTTLQTVLCQRNLKLGTIVFENRVQSGN
jgi:hypothetical protein